MDTKKKLGFKNWLQDTDHKVSISLSTDSSRNEIDIARRIYESESARDAVTEYYEQLKPLSICDAVESNNLRKRANILYKEDQKLEEAAFFYTKALYKAPSDSLCLARAHANRAIVLYKLRCYEAAFEDCTCAIEFKHPSLPAVLSRQVAIAWKLKDHQKIEHCIKSYKNLNIKAPDSVKAYYEKLKEAKAKSQELPELTMPQLPRLNKIRLSRNTTRGRFYIADEPIEAGELILEENRAVQAGKKDNEFRKAFFSTAENELVFTCDNCCEADIVPFPCYECRCVFYCSKICREEHFSMHRFECRGYKIQLLEENFVSHMALRILLTTFEELLHKLHVIRKNTVIHEAEELWPVLLQTAEDGELYSLHNNSKSLHQEVIQYGLLGFLFCYYLSDQTDFFNHTHFDRLTLMPSESEWHIVVIGLYLRFASTSLLNALTFNRLTVAKPFAANTVSLTGLYSSIKEDYSVCGLFPWFSFFNHSCQANTQIQMSGSKMCIYSNRRIASGEEVTFDYMTESARLNKNERKESLKQYLGELDCDCKRCQNEEDPILVKFVGVPCNCGSLCIVGRNKTICTNCGNSPDLVDSMFLIQTKIPSCSEEFIYQYGLCEIMRKALGSMGCKIFATAAGNLIVKYLKSTNLKILNDDIINSFMMKLVVDMLEITQNVYYLPLRRAVYAAMLLDIVTIRKKNGFQPIHFDHTIVERAIWVVTGKPRKMFDEIYKLYCF